MARPTPGAFFALDVRWLKRSGLLVVGRGCELTQRHNGRTDRTASILVGASVVKVRSGGCLDVMAIERTPQHMGGGRPWFLCPECGKRAAIVYGPRFACRACKGISYPSQREGEHDRLLRKVRNGRQRLGGSASMLEPFPARPWGMHARTYERLRRRSLAIEGTLVQEAAALLARMNRDLVRSRNGKRGG